MHSILIVDDDHDVRLALQDALEVQGWNVRCAIHGRDALEQLRNFEKPCVIILDQMMPVMDGPSFLIEKKT